MDQEYFVEENVKKLWAVELEIYQYFREFCKKHNLKHYAIGGTLLGAARHKGFIPWDDDMDVVMPYKDYMKFLKLASAECTYPYFMQCYLTDPVYGGITLSRLRRSDTTACTRWEYDNIGAFRDNKDYNMGIWLDILPLCYVPADEATRKEQKEQIMDVWRAVRGFGAWNNLQHGRELPKPEYLDYIKDYERYSKDRSIQEIKELYLERCGMNPPTEEVGVTSFRTFVPNLIWKTAWFADTIELPFEDTTVTCPVGYEQILTQQYGDWRTPVRNAAFHEIYLFDADVPFAEKFK